ncbi:MAG: hydrogenase 3 maturation endopeptidase HyCI, partial [Candidatus Omnitrophica bacterium]|nr:hydrogenase 3 maturation endopeptidase HyCI [Candidatus Omnitrophota bacterium]
MKNNFKDILKGKVVIVGIGNILRGDDAFGPVFIEKIKEHIDAICIDAGNAPENYVGKIAKLKPDTILIVDAVHLDLKPGEYEILGKNDINKSGFTTHTLSPVMFIEYLEKEIDANIYILGIQPKNTSFGEEISGNVAETLK